MSNNDQYNRQGNALQQQLYGLGQQMNAQQQAIRMQTLYGMAGGSASSLSCSEAYTAYISDFPPTQTSAPTPQKAKSMFKEIVADVKGFILEHRSVIYFLAFALLVDHFVFRGAFKARLQGCVDRLVTKVEEKIQ